MRFAWGLTAVGLGAWEATAFTTRRCPTISVTIARARRRHERATRLAVAAFALGMLCHLYNYEPV